jgi:hypothetical protein
LDANNAKNEENKKAQKEDIPQHWECVQQQIYCKLGKHQFN